jgi:SlyX protein
MVDGKVQVSGQASVMAINDMLLQTLMQKNPGLSFAVQESFPFKDMYPDALPLGPLMELGSGDAQTQFNTERASRSLQYWQSTAQQVLSDPEAANSPDVLKAERKPRRALLDFGRLQSQNPRMPDENSQRIDKLESHLAHLEHQVEQLNGVVIEQGKLLDRLKKETQRQSGFMQTLELERTKSNVQKPPHYQ